MPVWHGNDRLNSYGELTNFKVENIHIHKYIIRVSKLRKDNEMMSLILNISLFGKMNKDLKDYLKHRCIN
jgi:6-pyruvoyl-tetrahydropterin synthase